MIRGYLCTALQVVHSRTKCVEHRLRIKSEPEQACNHRRHHEPFPWRQVGELPAVRVWTLKSALHHPKRIEGGGENTETRDHGNRDADPVSTQQHEKLADEIAQSRQTERGQTEEERCSAQAWHHGPESTHPVEIASVNA